MKTSKNFWLALAFAGALITGAPPISAQDTPESSEAETNEVVGAQEDAVQVDPAPDAPEEEAAPVPAESEGEPRPRRVYTGTRHEAIVSVGKSVHLPANETAQAIVVIGGSVKVEGRVEEAVISVGGNVEINGEVGDAVIVVLGNVTAGPDARVEGDLISVGGAVERAPGAHIDGELHQVVFGGVGLPEMEWLRAYFLQCVMKLRPLAPQVGWAWAVAGVIFLLYLLMAALFPRPIGACVEELMNRPATTLFLGVLTVILTPLLLLLLATTGIGLLVVPFLIAALLLFAVVGKIALLQGVGIQLGRQMGVRALANPLPALLVGIVLLCILYIIPVIGLLVFLGTAVWSVGCTVCAAFSGMRRELPPPRLSGPPRSPAPMPVSASAAGSSTAGITSAPAMSAAPGSSTPLMMSAVPAVGDAIVLKVDVPGAEAEPGAVPPAMPEILAYARAGFWERIGAGFLDMVLVTLASSLVGGLPLGLLVAVAYFAGMWAWKQTTVGGIVLGLKVAREDGQPLSFPVALVRSLFAGFSIFVLFLGFFWIAWDRDKQGWHDKIAGTVVLRLPRSVPLLCV